MASYGITINQEDQTLEIDSTDEALYDSYFELEIKSTVEEEPSIWFNTTRIKINFKKPPCEVTQSEIDEVAGEAQLFLNATRGLDAITVSISEIVERANKAFKVGEETFCSEMKFEFDDNGGQYDFLQADLDLQTIKVTPSLSSPAG